jgi:hypothetical protein
VSRNVHGTSIRICVCISAASNLVGFFFYSSEGMENSTSTVFA